MKLVIRILFAAFVLTLMPTVSAQAQGKIESPLERKARLEREAAARKRKQQQEAAAQRQREEEARKKAEAEEAARQQEQEAREKAAREEAEREQAEREKAAREQAEREKKAKEQAEAEEAQRKEAALFDLLLHSESLKMVVVEGGTFKMGATKDQGSDVSKDEKPAHQVTLTQFTIGKCEVTQEVWEAVMGKNPSRIKGPKRPVTNVSHGDCEQFLQKLNKLTGRKYRLPTEAEWEFAARGGLKSQGYRYAGGNTLDAVAWYSGNSNRVTHDVGERQPNELGLYDMSGNVYEWCADRYAPYTEEDQNNPLVENPEGDDGFARFYIARGGSMINEGKECRVAYRRSVMPRNDYDYLGLRLAESLSGDDLIKINVIAGTYSFDGLPFPFENPTGSLLSDWADKYEDEMEELIVKYVRDEGLSEEKVLWMMDEDPHIAFLIATSDYPKSKKEKWLDDYREHTSETYPVFEQLAIKLYKERLEQLKKASK